MPGHVIYFNDRPASLRKVVDFIKMLKTYQMPLGVKLSAANPRQFRAERNWDTSSHEGHFSTILYDRKGIGRCPYYDEFN